MRTSEVSTLPVVTLAGDDVAQIKDVVYSADGGAVSGFTLAGRGLLAGPMREGLAWESVIGLGADAVIIKAEYVMQPAADVVAAAAPVDPAPGQSAGGDVLGSRVLTDTGLELGLVSDVIIAFGQEAGDPCDVVGYEIVASEALATKGTKGASKGTKLLVPLPDTLSVSEENLMVPASAADFVSHDLAGFGAAVEAFRTQLKGGASR